MITLTEKAKNIHPRRNNFEITPEVVELALAWAKDEVTISQIQKVLGVKEPNKAYAILARALKASINGLPIKKTKQSIKQNYGN